jgi:hypothetical protein
VLYCRKWVGASHPVRPCEPFTTNDSDRSTATRPAAPSNAAPGHASTATTTTTTTATATTTTNTNSNTNAAATTATAAGLYSSQPPPRGGGDYYRFVFRDHKVATVEKFIDDVFEYSFAYEYRPNGTILTVTTTRAQLGVLVEHFDDTTLSTGKDRKL